MFFRRYLTSRSTHLTAMKVSSGQDIQHLASVVNKLDELGEILEEMLQIQDSVEVRQNLDIIMLFKFIFYPCLDSNRDGVECSSRTLDNTSRSS